MPGKLQLFLLLILTVGSMQYADAQKSLIKAQKQFELKAFGLAIENAKKAIENKPDCVECHSVIAESFRMMNHNVDAAIWYRKMEKMENLPADFSFNYGLLLKRMGQYDNAKKYFLQYAQTDSEIATIYAESCDYAKELLSQEIDFELNLYNGSSKMTDFGATVYNDKIVFSSFRNDFKRSLEGLNKSQIQDQRTQMLMGGQASNTKTSDLDFLLPESSETFDFGPVHYAQDAPKAAVTKNNFRDGEQQIFTNDLELALYTASVKSDGSFNNLVPFPYNEVGYATGFGTLNPSGEIMYFSSNRPGGQGGFDIYVSYFKNGNWTYPENLGTEVNTPGNEVTPFYDGENLYFSSSYHQGMGGLDVFTTKAHNGAWMKPQNMGNGINSPEDDFYFTKQYDKETFYITSNRLGGRGGYDIYNVNKANTTKEDGLLAEVVDFEDVMPAEINLEEDLVVDGGITAVAKSVKYDESIEKNSVSPLMNETNTEVKKNTSPTSLQDNEISKEFKNEEGAIDFNKILPPKAVDLNKTNSKSVSLVGAKRVAYGEVIRSNTNVYFIQVAALFKTQANFDRFSGLNHYGSLYKFNQSNATKVKLGYFVDEYQAKDILRQVKSMGYNDAFITYEPLNTSNMELVELSSQSNTTTYATTGVNYKVRLASYEDPIWFDVNKVKGIGVIEQWTKAEWTIFVLSGYGSQSEAEAARQKAIDKGYADAQVVIDRNGILEKIN
jgi:tetratricopeptide (TPR) repeat protein